MTIAARLAEFAGKHMAIVGVAGSGKTYAAKGIVESLNADNRRVVILDPTGAWYGLGSKADGSPGKPVAIVGGDHGGVAIEAEHGEKLGEWAARRAGCTIIDLSEMLIGERHRFVEKFAASLYQHNRAALHLVIDEADEFCPQNPLPETRRMQHRIDQIVRRGRIKGFRVMMITQRPAVLHKNVLTQLNTLIAMRLTSPQDRKAIEAWIEGQGDVVKSREVLGSLAKLRPGEGWVWAPEHDVLDRLKFPPITTFDSSRAPDDGDDIQEPTVATVNYEELQKLLEPETQDATPALPRASTHAVDVHAEINRAFLRGVESARALEPAAFLRGWQTCRSAVDAALLALRPPEEQQPPATTTPDDSPPAPTPAPEVTRAIAADFREIVRRNKGGNLGRCERTILAVLAQHPAGRTRPQVAILSGYSQTSSGFTNALSALRSRDLITRTEPIQVTLEGRAMAGPVQKLPTGRALTEYWKSKLGLAERTILEVVVRAFPRSISKESLAQQSGYSVTSSGFSNSLSKLRTLQLISRGEIRAAEELIR